MRVSVHCVKNRVGTGGENRSSFANSAHLLSVRGGSTRLVVSSEDQRVSGWVDLPRLSGSKPVETRDQGRDPDVKCPLR